VKVSVCGCEVSLLCVCVDRCFQLKELAVSWCDVTDAGITVVITNCTQLCDLSLNNQKRVTGMYAVCEDPEPTLCFITPCCVIFLQ
jgi:hypothetical protein